MANISQTDFLKNSNNYESIGPLTSDSIKGVATSFSKSVGQSANVFTKEKGAGLYGFTPDKLESAGLLVPGTASQFCKDPAMVETVLSNPAVWTGKHGVEDLSSLLASESIQHEVQTSLFSSAHASLLKGGLLTGNETAESVTSMLSGAAKVGPDAMKSLMSGSASSSVVSAFTGAADSAKSAVSMVKDSLSAGLPDAKAMIDKFSVKITPANIKGLASEATSAVSSTVKGLQEEVGGLANNVAAMNTKIQAGAAIALAGSLPKPADMKVAANTVNFGELGTKLKSVVSNAKVPNAFADKLAAAAPSAPGMLDKAKGLVPAIPAVKLPQLPNIAIPEIPKTIDMSNPQYQTVTKTGLV
jgi:hypothetical protein